jgi:protein-disulfide isomerase
MRAWAWLLCTQILLCVALGVSAALYVHYLDPADSDFCGLRSGCEAVRRSGLAYFLGSSYLSLPFWSMLAHALVLGLSLRRGKGRAAALAEGGLRALWRVPELTLFLATGVGAIIALVLIGYQALALDAYCWLCMIVDVTALLSAGTAFAWLRSVRGMAQLPASPLTVAGWISVAALSVAGPLVWSVVRSPAAIPRQISALYQPGKINVVEFADFECPHCRRLYRVLHPLLAEYGERVAFRRFERPLPMHPNAEHAARAALCAEAQGKGPAMADRLFTVELSPESISAAAESLRLDPLRFDRCLDSAATTAILEQHAALLSDEEFQGLPTTYVGEVRFLGVPTQRALREARPPRTSLSGPVYALLLTALIALAAWFGRRAPVR